MTIWWRSAVCCEHWSVGPNCRALRRAPAALAGFHVTRELRAHSRAPLQFGPFSLKVTPTCDFFTTSEDKRPPMHSLFVVAIAAVLVFAATVILDTRYGLFRAADHVDSPSNRGLADAALRLFPLF